MKTVDWMALQNNVILSHTLKYVYLNTDFADAYLAPGYAATYGLIRGLYLDVLWLHVTVRKMWCLHASF